MSRSSMMAMVVLELFGPPCSSSIARTTTTAGVLQVQEPKQPLLDRIDIRNNRRISAETIWSIVTSKPGEPYSATHLESDLRALYNTGLFEDVQVQEKDGDTGKIITFIVVERPIILSVEYLGNKSFSESDILDAYKKNKRTPPTANALYNPQMIKTAEGILRDLMIQHGKPHGTVHTEIERVPPFSVRIRFVLNEKGEMPR